MSAFETYSIWLTSTVDQNVKEWVAAASSLAASPPFVPHMTVLTFQRPAAGPETADVVPVVVAQFAAYASAALPAALPLTLTSVIPLQTRFRCVVAPVDPATAVCDLHAAALAAFAAPRG